MNKIRAALPVWFLFLCATLIQAQTTGVPSPLQAGQGQTEALRISDGIYQATGFGNTSMVSTVEGNVIIDTSRAGNASRHKQLLQAVNDGPVRYIILTHGHGDHTGGIGAWRETDTEIIAQQQHVEFVNYQYRLRGFFSRRNAAQFLGLGGARGGLVPESSDIPTENYGAEIQPTILFDDRYQFELGDLTFEILHTPGETYDHLTVWIPEYRAAFVGDNIYGSFPNIYTLRGTKPRWALDYVNSLDRVLELEPEILISSHGPPILGKDEIDRTVGQYRDAILYVHDQTVAGMNEGKDVYTLMREIELPPELAVGEGYGTIAWTVRGIYEGYVGWFDGNPASMYGTPIDEVLTDLVESAGGPELLVRLGNTYLTEGQTVKALHAAEIALRTDPEHVNSLQLKLSALELLLSSSSNSNERGWLQSAISQTEAILAFSEN